MQELEAINVTAKRGSASTGSETGRSGNSLFFAPSYIYSSFTRSQIRSALMITYIAVM